MNRINLSCLVGLSPHKAVLLLLIKIKFDYCSRQSLRKESKLTFEINTHDLPNRKTEVMIQTSRIARLIVSAIIRGWVNEK
ncbi:hypothetical protein BK133_25030 [Paenibacillus sp. FSL H8-0548]|nr:hypothetical protein BK133_25030 [Paenibacillus sp. FSL H8-0548]